MQKKSKVALVVPSSAKKAYQDLANKYSAIEPPTWALLIAQALRVSGYDPIIFDYDADPKDDETAAQEIYDEKPVLAVFVLYGQNPNSGTTMMIGAASLASTLKSQYADLKIGFVGSHPSALPQEVIQLPYVDFAFINEGIYALLELLKSDMKSQLENIPGIWFKENGLPRPSKPGILVPQQHLDAMMRGYAWDLLPKDKYVLDKYRAHYWHTNFLDEDRTPFAAIYTSLGCTFGCNFCMINIVNRTSQDLAVTSQNSRGMRFWSPEIILAELEFLANNGVKTLRLSDEMFFLNRKYYEPILQGIIDKGFDFNIWAYARVDSVRESKLELFKKAGVNWLCLGIEAGNQNVRLEIEKGKFKQVDIRKIVAQIKDAGINILGNYIFGFPDDTIDTMNQTLDLAMELNCEHTNFYTAMALPGSPLYNFAKQSDWDLPRKFEEFAFLSYECKPLRTKSLSSEEVLRFRDDAWHKYFTNDSFLSLVARKFGNEAKDNVLDLAKIKLRRRILGD